MNKPIPLLSTLLGVWIIGTSMWYYQSSCCTVTATTTSTVSEVVTPAVTTTAPTVARTTVLPHINIQDGNQFAAVADDNFSFGIAKHEPIAVSDTLNSVFKQTADYLKTNPDRSLKITGDYGGNETNNSILATLGLGRANQIKKILVDLGASDGQIELADRLVTRSDTLAGMLTNLINYDFFTTEKPDVDRLVEVEQRLRANPLTLYFDTDAKTIDLTADQRQFFTDLTYFLSKKPKAGIRSTGHTDNRGDALKNKYLSRKRSEFVRDYLVNNGIQNERIWVFFDGEEQPIADNETSEGRAQNRRVEIRLR